METTHHTSTGHVVTVHHVAMQLTIAGPTETMDAIPEAELKAICRAESVRIAGVIDETTYLLAN